MKVSKEMHFLVNLIAPRQLPLMFVNMFLSKFVTHGSGPVGGMRRASSHLLEDEVVSIHARPGRCLLVHDLSRPLCCITSVHPFAPSLHLVIALPLSTAKGARGAGGRDETGS